MKDQNRVEQFLSEDLLVTLGAMKMALTWMGDDPKALEPVRKEIAALHERCLLAVRSIRQPNAPETSSDAPIDLDRSHADEVASVVSLDTIQERGRGPQGLPPEWLEEDELSENESTSPTPEIEPEVKDEDLGQSIDELLATATAQNSAAG